MPEELRGAPMVKVYNQGIRAGAAGQPASANPYPPGAHHDCWRIAYEQYHSLLADAKANDCMWLVEALVHVASDDAPERGGLEH